MSNTELAARQRAMFNCVAADLDACLAESLSDAGMLAMSILSDVQHMIEHGMTSDHNGTTVNQLINQAKYFITKTRPTVRIPA